MIVPGHKTTFPLIFVILFIVLLNACTKDEETEVLPVDDMPGWVKDADGNVYTTISIGSQVWMAENLRVTQYNNGDPIPRGLGNDGWHTAPFGAYAVYPNNNIYGLNSDEKVVNAYGKLYNWHAVKDIRGLCPAGYHVPDQWEWLQTIDYLMDTYNWTDDPDDTDGIGNKLRSCRQFLSPLGGDCDTDEHPFWMPHNLHFGTDAVGFNALPSGFRSPDGEFRGIRVSANWWTSSKHLDQKHWAICQTILLDSGAIESAPKLVMSGYSVRCVRSSE